MRLEGDFGPPPEGQSGQWPPFRSFGDLYYTYQLSLDLKVEEGWAVRFEPHPRFYTDPTDTTPIAVPALIRRWWPMVFFLVFKSPPEGKTHIFRPGEPFAQILVVPEEATFDLVPMSDEEAAERELQSRRIFRAAGRYRPRRNGGRRQTPFLTAPTGIFSAPRPKRPSTAADSFHLLQHPYQDKSRGHGTARAQCFARAQNCYLQLVVMMMVVVVMIIVMMMVVVVVMVIVVMMMMG